MFTDVNTIFDMVKIFYVIYCYCIADLGCDFEAIYNRKTCESLYKSKNSYRDFFLSKPPSQATNSVIPKHIRKAPVAVLALYNKAKYAV